MMKTMIVTYLTVWIAMGEDSTISYHGLPEEVY